MTNPGPITRLGAQRAARHELSKAIYHRDSEPLPARLVHDVGHWIDQLLSKTLSRTPAGSAGAIAIVVLIAVVAALLIWRSGIPRRTAEVGVLFEASGPTSAAEHLARSEQAASAGDWKAAVLERTRALARELEERGVIEARPGRTATELARAAGQALPAERARLTAAADTFNRVAYGDRTATATDLESVIAADDAVRRTRRATVPAQ
jgi:hypothetical protein